MERRKFVASAGAGMAGILAAGAPPALAFLEDEILWFRVCEANYDAFMQSGRRKA